MDRSVTRIAHQFDLNRLQAFVAVAEIGSITAAAARLGVAQPALSASIRRLEADLGVTLFERLPRGVAPTAAGRRLLPRAYEVFAILGAMQAEFAELGTEPSGDLSIGLPPSTAAVLTQPLLGALSARFPKVSLRLVEAMSGYLWDWLEAGELDIAVTFNARDTPTVISKPLLQEEMMLIGAVARMQGLPEPFPFEGLAELPLIVTSRRHRLRTELDRRLESHGLTPNIRFEIDAGHQLVRLVGAGAGYGVFARSAFVDELAAGRVRAIALAPGYQRTVCLSHHRRKSADPIFARFVAGIEGAVAEVVASGDWPCRPA